MDAAASRLLGAEGRYRLAGRKVPALGAGSGARDTLPAWGFLPLPRRGEQGGVFDPVVPVCEQTLFWGPGGALGFSSFLGWGKVVVEGEWPMRPSPLCQRREVEHLSCAWMGVEFTELRGAGGAEEGPTSWARGWGLLPVFVVVDTSTVCNPLVCP